MANDFLGEVEVRLQPDDYFGVAFEVDLDVTRLFEVLNIVRELSATPWVDFADLAIL